MTYGLTPAGFVVKPFAAILAALQGNVLASPALGAQIDLSATSPEGQFLSIIANEIAEPWELLGTAFNAFNRGAAEGALLDNLGALSGTPRNGPTSTQVLCSVTVTTGSAPYAAGSLVASVAGEPAFTFANAVTITDAMISAGVASGILFVAQTPGATPSVNPNTLTSIVSPVTGWTAITNPAAQTVAGTNEELDALYAVRQAVEIADEGTCNQSATAAALLQLLATVYAAAGAPATYSVSVYENATPGPLNVGSVAAPFVLPPKSFAVVLYDHGNGGGPIAPTSGPAAPTGTAPTSVAAAIWLNKPAGIQAYGTATGVVTDPILGQQTMAWSTPAGVALSIVATVAIRVGFTWAGTSGVQAAIQAALVAAAVAPTPASGVPPVGQLTPGTSVVGSQLEGVIMQVAGVFDVQVLTFGGSGFAGSPNPSSNTSPIAVSPLQVATVAIANITLTQGALP